MIELLLYPMIFSAGLGTGYAMGRRARGATLVPMSSSARDNRRAYIAGTLVLVMLILAGVFVAKQVTEAAADEAASERTAAFEQQAQCLAEWGKDVTDTINIRNAATKRLDRAESLKDRAFDEVIRVSTLLRRIPPEAVEGDLVTALETADAARKRVAAVREEVNATKAMNSYPAPPTLTCAVEIENR